LYSSLNRISEAIEYYKKALRIEQNNPETYMLLGNVHYLNNDLEQSVQAYRASISLAPDNDEYRLIYSQVMEDYVKSVRGEKA
jgi:cytochrome c-type biogenesis protein CcmH/NrfG